MKNLSKIEPVVTWQHLKMNHEVSWDLLVIIRDLWNDFLNCQVYSLEKNKKYQVCMDKIMRP